MAPTGCALVTGAASGIGRATARRLARDGYRVHIMDIDLDGAQETVDAINDAGGQARVTHVDLADPASIETAVGAVLDVEADVRALVNNAGYMAAGTLPDTEPAVWDRLIDINLTAPYLLCRALLPVMLDAGGGIIVNVASAGALVGIRERAAYCATKAGLLGLTRCIAADHAHQGIRANAICPGTTETEWISRLLAEDPNRDDTYARMSSRQLAGRMGTPDEIAAGISFLCSSDATFVNGTAFVVDGGMTAV